MKSCVLVRNKSIIKIFLTLNYCFWTKYQSIIHNDPSSSEIFPSTVVLSHQNPLIYICLELCLCLIGAYFSSDSDSFSLEKPNIMEDLYFSWKQQFEVKKNHNDGFSLFQLPAFRFINPEWEHFHFCVNYSWFQGPGLSHTPQTWALIFIIAAYEILYLSYGLQWKWPQKTSLLKLL